MSDMPAPIPASFPPAGPGIKPEVSANARIDSMMGGKAPQAEVHYRPAATPDQSCSSCANFQPPQSCAVVAGVIDPHGVSDLFTPEQVPGAADALAPPGGGEVPPPDMTGAPPQ